MDDTSYVEVSKQGFTYVSPKGDEFADLRYRVIPQERARRHQTYEFIGVDGTLVQDLGLSSKRYSLALYLVGQKHHVRADEFEAALEQPGVGAIFFPLDRGPSRNVVALKYRRENRYAEAENVTYFEVEFQETISSVDPKNVSTVARNRKAAMQQAIDFAKAAQAANLSVRFASLKPDLALVNHLRSRVRECRSAFGKLLNTVQRTRVAFDSAMASLDSSANLLFEQPLLVIRQVQSALQTPVFPRVSDTLTAYGSFLGGFSDYTNLLGAQAKDLLSIDEMFGLSASFSYAGRALSLPYNTRAEAVDTFASVQESFLGFMDYVHGAEAQLSTGPLARRYYMDPDTYAAAYSAMTTFSGSLDALLMGLRKEAVITLDKDMTPLNVAERYYPAEFRQNPIAAMDFVLRTNAAEGYNILLFEKGTEVKVLV